ncbi:substrate-binding periplasmic protein [Spartinivicinus ruber]|uniref:substrate-binding periplasmic protein n=1 Tax=Spartinivicinus ruber TaxID=2683272 RepID=UPI0013CFBB6B|nr:transporter substrate-binding domain-containing protein [Spartinivicinus ruber]
MIGYSEFFPFMYTTEGSEVKGLDIKLVRKVFEKAGCKIELVNMPWSRIVMGLKNGVPDVALVASKTKERSMYAYFSVPYRNEQMRFMIRKNEAPKWPIQSLQDVIKYKMRIAVVLSNWFGEEFDELKKNKEFKSLISGVTEVSNRFSMLSLKRIDAILHDKVYLTAMAKKLGKYDDIEFLPFVVNDDPVHFMFSKKTTPKTDLELINQMLKEFKKTPEYRELFGDMKTHFSKD